MRLLIAALMLSGSLTHADPPSIVDKQRELELTLRDRIREIVDRILGPDRSVVVVTANMDSSHSDRTEELFGKDPLLRTHSRRTDFAPPAEGDDKRASRTSESKTFELNRVLNRTVDEPMKLKRLHVAIAIDGELPPRMQDQIVSLVREAAGLDPDRGDRLELQSVHFAAPAGSDASLAFLATGAIPLLLGVGFAVRKRKPGKPISAPIGVTPPAPTPATRERVREVVRQDADRAARILSAWLRETEEIA